MMRRIQGSTLTTFTYMDKNHPSVALDAFLYSISLLEYI
jgi:hypothetical protein